jgi:hypothetical protein
LYRATTAPILQNVGMLITSYEISGESTPIFTPNLLSRCRAPDPVPRWIGNPKQMDSSPSTIF